MEHDDCREVQASLYEYLDWELSLPEEATVELHLADCRHCRGRFEFEAGILQTIREKCREIRAPGRLRGRIAALINEL
jgi:mycothiol system anti-sigma-R factor